MHRHASLNRIYRLVWSHVHRTWVVVAETARGRGKRSSRKLLLATATLAVANLAQAGPTGGQVTAGTGTIGQSGTATTVTQNTRNMSLTWQSFNTNAAESVNFVQPSNSAIAVNRILDANPTQFMGRLNANGQVYLINPNGVLFGAGAQVNVGGLVASTLDVADDAAGGAARRFSGAGTGSVVNRGTITAAPGGYVAFVGNKVGNQGTIGAPAGTVALGAGSDVTLSFAGNSLVGMQVNRGTLDNLADNGGLIRADGGTVIMTAGAKDAVLASVVNNTGVVEAHSVQDVGGTIVLGGGAQTTTTNAGTLDASGTSAGTRGGTVKVLGDTVNLAGGSRIDVSGDAGGGLALVGGNFLGGGPERNAQNTTVAAGAGVNADALRTGDGGRVAVWSDGTTQFHGAITAHGGQGSGNGGYVETSGHTLKVGSDASVNTLAPHGAAGEWLLDPNDLVIGGWQPGDGDIDGQDITNALQNNNVTIKTSVYGPSCAGAYTCSPGRGGYGDIIMADGSLIGGGNWTNGTTLTLSAYRNIDLRGSASIDAGFGPGNVVLRADNAATGTGTVLFSNGTNIFGNGFGTIKIYYNPASYSSPTDYANMHDMDGNLTIRDANLSTYMYVNLLVSVADKTYDGTTAATYSGLSTLNGLPSGVTLNTSGASMAFTDKTAGTNKAVVINGLSLTGVNANKYELNGLATKTANISKASVTVTGVTAVNKTYNGNASTTLAGTPTVAAFGGDVVSVGGTVNASFADKNVGTGKAVLVSGYTLGGTDAANYNIVQPSGLSADITRANLIVAGITAANKTYDGSAAATLLGTAAVTPIGSDVVSVTGTGTGTFASKNAGIRAVTVTGYTLAGTDAGNYNIVQPTNLVAAIAKANLALTGIGAANKVYDGTTSATLTGSATVSPIGSDDVAVSGGGNGAFASKNAGTGKAITVTGYSLTGADAGNYNLVRPTNLTADITKADLVIAGIGANNKTYDGTTAATLSGSATAVAIGSDIVTVGGTGSASFADKNVGTNKAVVVSGYTLSGLDAGNYNLVQPSGLAADITKAGLAVTGVAVANKTYDGTTAATLNGTATVTAFGSDTVAVNGTGSASFADKNAGTNKAVTVSGYTLAGLDAGNYDVVQPTGLTASIGKASLAVTGATAADKTYDGTTAATLSGTATVAAFGNDAVSVNGTGNAFFANKNAGANKAVAVNGYTLTGTDAGNYNIVQPSGLTATIAKADLALSGLAVSDKPYDGTTAATLSGFATVSPIGVDVVTLAGSGSAAFVDKNAGTNKAVTVGGYTLGGLDAGNYNLVTPSGLTANIGKASLAVTGVTAANKTYDGTTAATLNGTASVAAFGNDAVTVTGPGTGTFADKNVGIGKAVTVSGYTLGGNDAANYNVVQPAGLSANIARASLALSGVTAGDKVYDGTTAATLIGTATVTGFGTDVVTVGGGGTATFADKNAGTNKAVTVSGYTLSGADAVNYTIAPTGGLAANIAKADLALTGIAASNKTYDGTTAAALTGTATVSAIGSDVVAVSGPGTGAFVDKNAGAHKAVTVGGYTLTGLDAGNYNLVAPAGLTADIGKASVAMTGVTAANKTYDGTTAALLSGTPLVAVFGSDAVTVSGTGIGTFADRNAGNNRAVTVSGYTLGGLDAGNYNLIQPTGLTADIARANLAVTGVTAANKTYDGTTAATLSGTAAVAAFGNDVVSLSGTGLGTFADKNAGTNKAVTVSGYTLTGGDAGNYNLVQPTGLAATISKANLAVTGVTAANKTYDGTADATLSGTAAVSAIGNDAVTVSGPGTATFADKNAGANKAVTVSGYTLGGLDAGNYNVVQPTGLAADIARANLAVTGVTAVDKTYDGTTAATLAGAATVTAFGSDAVSVGGSGAAVFTDKNAGNNKAVAVNGYTLGGTDAGNYNLVQPVGLSANIARANLAVTGVTAANKTYDGTTAATLSGTVTVSAFGNDAVVVSGPAGATFADKNVGANKAVTVSGYTLSGSDAGNYNVVQPAGLAAAITPAQLAVGGIVASDKVFDGTTAATVSTAGAVLGGKVGTDDVTLASTGTFADAAAGTGKTVNLRNTYGGADIGNYTIVDQATALASITPAPVTPTPPTPPTTPVTPVTPVTPTPPVTPAVIADRIRDVVTQVQSAVLPPQATAQPGALNLSSTVSVSATSDGQGQNQDGNKDEKSRGGAINRSINTVIGGGASAPSLQIQNGGVQLPPLATTINE